MKLKTDFLRKYIDIETILFLTITHFRKEKNHGEISPKSENWTSSPAGLKIEQVTTKDGQAYTTELEATTKTTIKLLH